MELIGDYNFLSGVQNNAVSFFQNVSEPVAYIIGIVLVLAILSDLMGWFNIESEPTITIQGKTLTQKDINNEEKMPMEWFRNLSPEDQKRISDFDHEQARKQMGF